MDYINPIIRKFQSQNLVQTLESLINENKELIVQAVREQWKQGLRPNGTIIGTYRSFAYEQEKRRRNPLAGGKVDLFDTGDLSKGLTINKVLQLTYTIFSTDDKAVMIAEKYGLDVYGLSDEEQDSFFDMVGAMTLELIFNKAYE